MKSTTRKYDFIFYALCLAAITFSGLLLAINAFTSRYPVIDYPTAILRSNSFLISIPLYISGFYLYKIFPRLSLLLKTYGMCFIIAIVMLIVETGAFTTPFHLQDNVIYLLDKMVGFNLLTFINHTYQYPWLITIANAAYYLLFPAIMIVPIILALLKDERQVYTYVYAYIISCLIGFAIYYFFPSSDPANVFHSKYLPAGAEHVVLQFRLDHHYNAAGYFRAGYVGLPSFHTIWSVLIACVTYHRKYLFYPIAFFSSAVIASTLILGWHFLMDDIAGIIVALISFYLAKKCLNSQFNLNFVKQKIHSFLPSPRPTK